MTDQTETKDCPFCGEKINIKAIKCKFCRSELVPSEPVASPSISQAQPPPQSQSQTDTQLQKCSKCGMMIPLNIKRCPHCNEDLKPGCLKVFFMALAAIFLLWFSIKMAISGIMSH
jgi:hypothetical protein